LIIVGKDVSDIISGCFNLETDARTVYLEALLRLIMLGGAVAIQSYITAATVCVSLFAEALPVSWIEADCTQKPIVASNIGLATDDLLMMGLFLLKNIRLYLLR
jgi:hypothetical protein